MALYFHFRCFPRGAVSPYIYLIAAPPDRELFSYTENRLTAAAYSSAHFAPPLYGQFPFPLSRVLQIIKSSLREDWSRCLDPAIPFLYLRISLLLLLLSFPFSHVPLSRDHGRGENLWIEGPLFISRQIFLFSFFPSLLFFLSFSIVLTVNGSDTMTSSLNGEASLGAICQPTNLTDIAFLADHHLVRSPLWISNRPFPSSTWIRGRESFPGEETLRNKNFETIESHVATDYPPASA